MRSSPRARATAWVRLVAPSFSIMWLTCFLTVSMLTTSCVAMALLDWPAAIMVSTSTSRLVSWSIRPGA